MRPEAPEPDTSAYVQLVRQSNLHERLWLLALWRLFDRDADSRCLFSRFEIEQMAKSLLTYTELGTLDLASLRIEILNQAFFRRDVKSCTPEELPGALARLCDRFFYTRLPLFRLLPDQMVELQPEWGFFYRKHGRLLTVLLEDGLIKPKKAG